MADLIINEKSVGTLLNVNVGDTNHVRKQYVIPDFQRPYRWELGECEKLWEDIEEFYNTIKGKDGSTDKYFLGTIVTYEENGEINIIDGQQRITSLMLLLRAFYEKLEEIHKLHPEDNHIKGPMGRIERCIWQFDYRTNERTDTFNLQSKVVLGDTQQKLENILREGSKAADTTSNYGINYKYFYDQSNKYKSNSSADDWEQLCLCVLDRCVILPITCPSMESALTIFDTLNNRGMPLEDADLFKVEIYKTFQTDIDKQEFIDDWKELSQNLKNIDLTLDDLFGLYIQGWLAQKGSSEKQRKGKLRRLYKDSGLLKEATFFERLKNLADFWKGITDYNMKYCTSEGAKYLHCLFLFPNNYWRYVITTYYMKNKDNFSQTDFEEFTKHLVAYLYMLYIERPSATWIKNYVFTLCGKIWSSEFSYGKDMTRPIVTNFEDQIEAISQKKWNLLFPLLVLQTYIRVPNQKRIIGKVEIEHILPHKWENANYHGIPKTGEGVNEHIESIGNKILLSKKSNIQAGDKYFGEKKQYYRNDGKKNTGGIEVKLLEPKQLADKHLSDDWMFPDIEARKKEICKALKNFFCKNLKAQN